MRALLGQSRVAAAAARQRPARPEQIDAGHHQQRADRQPGVSGSSRTTKPMAMVDSGPIMPTRRQAGADALHPIITSSTGSAVHRVELSSDSHSTGSATRAACHGLTSRKCAMQHRLATTEARPTSRRAADAGHEFAAEEQVQRIRNRRQEHPERPQAVAAPGVSRTSMPNTSSAPP